ncbi:TPA: hypothetical protein ACGO8V_002069 [Streptococcus suis]
MTEKKLSEQTTLLSTFKESMLREVRMDSWKNVILHIKDQIVGCSSYEVMTFVSRIGNETKSDKEIISLLEEIANADAFNFDYHFQVEDYKANDFGNLWIKANRVEFRFKDDIGDDCYYCAQLLNQTKGVAEGLEPRSYNFPQLKLDAFDELDGEIPF